MRREVKGYINVRKTEPDLDAKTKRSGRSYLVKRGDLLALLRATSLSELAGSVTIPGQTLATADLLLQLDVRRRSLRVVRILLVVPDGFGDDGLPRREGLGDDEVDEGGDEEAVGKRERGEPRSQLGRERRR